MKQSPDGIECCTIPHLPGRSLTAAQCQTYEQIAQCRMDCLLELSVGSMELFGYIHLRAISCNETLFTTSIGNIFNNQNNIQPIFTARQSVESKILSLPFSVSMTVPMSSATIVSIFSSSTILLSAVSSSTNLSTTTTALTTSQLVLQSTSSTTLSTTASIQHISSPSQFISVINGE